MWERRRKPSFEVNDLTVPPASVSSASSVSSPLSPGTDGFAHAPNGCHDHGPGHWKKMAQKEYMYKKIFNTRLHSIKPLAPTPTPAWSLRASASLHLSDLPLSLSLPLPLSLLLDLVKGQDIFLLLTGRFAVPTLWALEKNV